MAQFDYYRRSGASGYLLDCQADVLQHLNTRLVVPLLLGDWTVIPARHLNPVFTLDGLEHIMATQFAAAIPAEELHQATGSLADERYVVLNALDFLITGISYHRDLRAAKFRR